jgi:hypothetical protein
LINRIPNITFQIYSRLDLTSMNYLDIRDRSLSPKEYSRCLRDTEFASKSSERLLQFIANYDHGFYCPEKCNVYEPIRDTFKPSDLSIPIRWLSQASGRVIMKKLKPFKYEGFVENHRFSNHWINNNKVPEPRPADPIFLTEWCLWFQIKLLEIKPIDEIVRFFIDLYLVSEGDYGFLTMQEDHENKNYLIMTDPNGETYSSFIGDSLEQCLPGVYWANIFGRLYVKWFGENKFRTLPCYRRDRLSDGSYYVQCSNDLFYYKKTDVVSYEKEIINHLGKDAFFDIREPDKICQVPEYIKLKRRIIGRRGV